MGVARWGRKAFTSVVNVRVDHWIGLENIKGTTGFLFRSIMPCFRPEETDAKDSFNEAIKKLNLSEDDINLRKQEFQNLFILHLFISALVFCYSMYLFATNNWGGGLMTLCIFCYPLAITFKFHFWLYQMKTRKLGHSLRDWWDSN